MKRTSRRRLGAAAELLFSCLMAAEIACSGAGTEEKPAPPRTTTVAERLSERPDWLAPGDTLSPASFEKDPHAFDCARCHGPRPGKSAKEWKATCTASGCHFRAWPRTVFHRVTLAVFNKCDNCHRPHVWKLDGQDCAACHAGLLTPGTTVKVTQIGGVLEFPHGRHASLECRSCHESEQTHGALKIGSAAECRTCHHGPPPAAACSECHEPQELAGPHRIARTVHVASTSQPRKLPFDHERHADLACESCHASDRAATPSADCVSCHEFHHQPESRCANCHEPPRVGVHDLSVHEIGCATAGCHGPNGFQAMESNRNFCMSCHLDKSGHYAEKNCESCHKLGPGPAGGP